MSRLVIFAALLLTFGISACAAEHPHHGGGWREDLEDHDHARGY